MALYLTSLEESGAAASTIQRRIAAISAAHKAKGETSPTADELVRRIMGGIRRERAGEAREVQPLVAKELLEAIAALPSDALGGLRDRALLLVGFQGAMRRSELVALDVRDLEWEPDGVRVWIRKSKTDQVGRGQDVFVPDADDETHSPTVALRAWLAAARIADGPIFRRMHRSGSVLPERLTAQSVALIVKRAVDAAGLDPTDYAGHSLRAGHATSAAGNEAPDRLIMQQTRHKSRQMMERYVRPGSGRRETSADYTGL